MDVKHASWLIVCFAVAAGCEPSTTVGMNPFASDLRTPPSGDLAGVDLAMMMYKANVPTCTPVTSTATTLYQNVVMASCSCHKTGFPRMANAADLVALVNKMPRSAMMPLVTSGDVNRSYLIFRLTGQGDLIPGGSSGFMPLGGNMLTMSQMCQWINWINGGTPQ
jgi:hypothetical protein